MSEKTGGLEFDDTDDFARMLAGDPDDLKKGFDPGEKVSGIVVSITSSSILVDIGAKSEGILERSAFEEDGKLTIAEGDTVEAYFVGMENGEIVLATKMKSHEVDDAELQQAYEAQIPVEGKVTGTNNAGLEVSVGGIRGFCPASHIDRRHVEDLTVYNGQTLTFMVLEYSQGNLVVSRRMHLESQAKEKVEQLKQSLHENDNITGTVTKLMDFGAFVDLGGTDGLIPMGELAWERIKDAGEVVSEGEQVTVKVIKLDWDNNRITLSLKQAGSDPWDGVEDKLMSGTPYTGKVTRLMDFGAFVQLEPGLEGLLHISKLGAGRRVGHPREVLQEGQEIEVFVDSVDPDKRRISLNAQNSQSERKIGGGDKALIIGATVTGTVDGVKQFGVFVQLPGDQKGLLHVSEIEANGGNRNSMVSDYPVGKQVQVVVKGQSDGKISLSLPGAPGEAAEDIRQLMQDEKDKGEGFGSIGGLFDNVKL